MKENEITQKILDICFNVHTKLGPGLFESVYSAVIMYELKKTGIVAQSDVPVPVYWDEIKLDVGFKADIVVENKVIIELKSVEVIAPVHKKQLLTYLRIMDKKVGLLINFNNVRLKDGITRIINGSDSAL
jgi:GxxExxY protein